MIDATGKAQVRGGGQQPEPVIVRESGAQCFQILRFGAVVEHVHLVIGSPHALEGLQARQSIGGVVPVEDEYWNAQC